MRRLPAALAIAALIATAPAAAAPTAAQAWVRLNPVPGRPSAGYVTIRSDKADKLTAASAPGVRIEIHSMTMANGVMSMRQLETLPIAAGDTALKPGGNHLMIFGLTSATRSLPVTLTFASGAKLTVPAPVRAASDEMPMPHGHDGH